MALEDHELLWMIMMLLLVPVDPMQVQSDPNDDFEGIGDGESDSDDNSKDQVLGDPAGEQYEARGFKGGHGSIGTPRTNGTSCPSFHKLACQIPNLFNKG